MARYCVNKNAQKTGEHEVHNVDTCTTLPMPDNRRGLGEHSHCSTAVAEAKKYYANVDGCKICSEACHTR